MGFGHMLKELALVSRSCVITPHIFQQIDLLSKVYVNNCSMGNLANEILDFLYNNLLLFWVETLKLQQIMLRI
jgi:hypothetical protein